MIDTVKFFKEKKYVLIKEMIPKDIAKVATQYSHYDRARMFQPETENAQIPGSHSVYGDPLMETLLNFGRKTIEKSTGLELWPTYSYYRLYKVGDMLKRHKDKTLALLTGFILGSLNIIWPWKAVTQSLVINGEEKVIAYTSFFPTEINNNTLFAIIFMLVGFILVYLLEKSAKR